MNKDYTVGYRKPPKSGQFQKGRSGNPMGRPPKPKTGYSDVLLREMNEVVQTKDGQKMTKMDAMFKNLVNGATKGDLKNILVVLKEVHKAEGKQLAQMFWDRFLADGFIEPDAARDYANKRDRLKLNMGILKQEQVSRIRAIGAVGMLEAIAYFNIMEEVSLWAERIRCAVFAEFEFWVDVGAGWDTLGLSDGQREMVYQHTLQLRAYERPTVEMLQKSVELCARMRHQCDMWYMAYRDIYADMPLIKSTVRDIRRSKSENISGIDKSILKNLQVLLSARRRAYDDFMVRDFPFANWTPKYDLTTEDVQRLFQWYLSGHNCMNGGK